MLTLSAETSLYCIFQSIPCCLVTHCLELTSLYGALNSSSRSLLGMVKGMRNFFAGSAKVLLINGVAKERMQH